VVYFLSRQNHAMKDESEEEDRTKKAAGLALAAL
jgi:hypothetical protein